MSWSSLVLFDEVMRLYLNFHTYNDKSEVDYLIYGGRPASSKSRQISPVNVISCPKFIYRFPSCFEDRKARFLTKDFLAQFVIMSS